VFYGDIIVWYRCSSLVIKIWSRYRTAVCVVKYVILVSTFVTMKQDFIFDIYSWAYKHTTLYCSTQKNINKVTNPAELSPS
jgi:hypothetical protein